MKVFFPVIISLVSSSICMASNITDNEDTKQNTKLYYISEVDNSDDELERKEKETRSLQFLEKRFELLLKLKNLIGFEDQPLIISTETKEKTLAPKHELEVNEIVLRNNMADHEVDRIFRSTFLAQQLIGITSLLKEKVSPSLSDEIIEFENMIKTFKEISGRNDIDLNKVLLGEAKDINFSTVNETKLEDRHHFEKSGHLNEVGGVGDELECEGKEARSLLFLEKRFELLLKLKNLIGFEDQPLIISAETKEKTLALKHELEVNEIVLRNNMADHEVDRIFGSTFLVQQLIGIASLLKEKVSPSSPDEIIEFENMIKTFKEISGRSNTDLNKL